MAIPVLAQIEPLSSETEEGRLPQDELRTVWNKAWGLTPVRHDRTAALMLSWHPDDNDDGKVHVEVGDIQSYRCSNQI